MEKQPDGRRYADLSLPVRAFLETLDDQGVVTLADSLRFYRELPEKSRVFLLDAKPSTLECLLNAKPSTLEWLREARDEEIDQLKEGIGLVQASRTVGRFVKWVIITIVAAFVGAVALGKAFQDFWHWIVAHK